MTSDEIIIIASRKARSLNMPWGPDLTVTPCWRLWPFARRWKVVSRVQEELSETTIIVNERTCEAMPRRVHVARRFGPPENRNG